MKRLPVIGALVALMALTGCTTSQVAAWIGWHQSDPVAAEEFASRPEVQAELAEGIVDDSSDGPQFAQYLDELEPSPGDCDSYTALFRKYGLPVATFKRIAWRESGCNHTSWVVDHDDLGGGLLGINFKTQQLRNGWMSWCGAAPNAAFRYDADKQVECAAAAYARLGLSPWQ